MDLVSVIMPIHNRFDLVDQAVDSVINQTYRPIELLIVDDFSDSVYIPNQHNSDQFEVKVIRLEKNSGPGATREAGRVASRGKYIAYLDSDDLWHPQKLEKQVMELIKNQHTGMCYCQTANFSDLPITGNEPIRYQSEECHTVFFPIIMQGRPWHTSSYIWTRDASDKVGPWMAGWHFEDYEYDVRAGCKGISISYVPEILCYARKSKGALTTLSEEKKLIPTIYSAIQISKNLRTHKILISDKITRENLESFLSRLIFSSIGCVDKRILSNLVSEKAKIVINIWRKTVLFISSKLILVPSQTTIVSKKSWLRKFLAS